MKLLVTTLAIALFQIPVFAQEVLEHRDFKIAQICYEKAKDHFDYAQYDSALYYFSRAIKFNPNNSDYFFGRASSYNNLGNIQKAAEDMKMAIEMEPDQPDYHYFGANIFFKTKKYESAVKNYTRAINHQGNNDIHINLVNCYYNRGVSYMMLKEYGKAVTDFNQVLKINPSFAQAYHNRGVSLRVLDKLEMACDDFEKALDLGIQQSRRYIDRYCKFNAAGG